jgi:hypothetical protein
MEPVVTRVHPPAGSTTSRGDLGSRTEIGLDPTLNGCTRNDRPAILKAGSLRPAAPDIVVTFVRGAQLPLAGQFSIRGAKPPRKMRRILESASSPDGGDGTGPRAGFG